MENLTEPNLNEKFDSAFENHFNNIKSKFNNIE
jgi:hypothetical protein